MGISFSQKIQVWLDSLLAKDIKIVLALDPGRVGASTCLGCKKNGVLFMPREQPPRREPPQQEQPPQQER